MSGKYEPKVQNNNFNTIQNRVEGEKQKTQREMLLRETINQKAIKVMNTSAPRNIAY